MLRITRCNWTRKLFQMDVIRNNSKYQIGSHGSRYILCLIHYYRNGHLSQFWNRDSAHLSRFWNRDSAAGTKASRL